MPLTEDVKNDVDNIVSSYEAKIRSIGAIFDTTHQLLQSFQHSFLDTKQQREQVSAELRESLAQNESLRKKDFDNMMREILSNQDEREKQVRNLLNCYLDGQKEMAHTLRSNLAKIKDALAEGQARRAEEFLIVIKEIVGKQEKRKQEAILKLKEFQKEQQQMSKRLKELLGKGSELRIKDLKLMLAEFKTQRKERVAHQKERRQEVQSVLSDFKKEGVEAAGSWGNMQQKVVQRKADSPTTVNVGA